MCDARGSASFCEEALTGGWGRCSRRNELDRDQAVQEAILCEVDASHRAGAEQADQPVLLDLWW